MSRKYIRTTRDEWQLLVRYDAEYGYEHKMSARTLEEIRQIAKDYAHWPTKIRAMRVPIKQQGTNQ